MTSIAEVIQALAALIGVLVWPLVVAFFLFPLRAELKNIINRLPELIGRMQSFKIGIVEANLTELVANLEDASGTVTPKQVRVAAALKLQADTIGSENLLQRMDALAREYDAVRRSMQSGPDRTRKMTEILAQMRGLSEAVSHRIDIYKSSGAAGSRLAAVAMMQMQPEIADIEWLEDRFSKENPFIFYHAALALQNVVDSAHDERRERARKAALRAANIVEAFEGESDRETLDVLNSLNLKL